LIFLFNNGFCLVIHFPLKALYLSETVPGSLLMKNLIQIMSKC